jgi:CheY-like chemotaxis protein
MFVQGARGPDRAEGGLGLGLALVASLTALHDGSVEAHSAGTGQGSEFVVRLPAVASHRRNRVSTPHAPVSVTKQQHRLRILVVDDNEDAAEMLQMILEAQGHEVRVAHDPPLAVAVADSFTPQLAIVDIGLPVMDGYELAQELRARLGIHAPKLVALSGYGQDEDKQKSAASGFVAHLVKPLQVSALLELIDGLKQR